MSKQEDMPEILYVGAQYNDGSHIAYAAPTEDRYGGEWVYIRADTAPELSQEKRQLLELHEVIAEFHKNNADRVTIERVYSRTAVLINGYVYSVTEAIAELRARLRPEPPVRPTAAEWYEAETTSDPEARRQKIRALIERNLAAEKWERGQRDE